MPETAPSPAGQTRLPPLAWAGIFGGGLLALAIVVLLSVQLAVLRDSQEHIRAQDAKITTLFSEGRAALREAGPAVRDARPALRQAGPALRDARRVLRPLGRSSADLAVAARQVAPLLRSSRSLAAATIPLVQALNESQLPRVVAGADVLLGTLLYRQRLAHLMDTSQGLIEQIEATQLIDRASHSAALAPTIVKLQRRLLKVQKATLTAQRRALDVQTQTLIVQRQALSAIESIDRKTGGRFPPGSAATPAAP